MSKEIAIKIENVSKQYRLGVVGTGTLSHDLKRWWTTSILRKEDPYLKIGETNDRASKGKSEYVWALKDINLEINKGDVVGIIGKNGAGKSTLLKLLSRVTKPTTGSISYNGRIASLLEVGTGFHPEMTGRENIYMNGAIMGMTRSEITAKLDEIIAFAGVKRYIDTPVKRYSSGMTVRLGFSIAAHLEPDILVVDEVLAVGDAEFQKKAIGKMQDVSKGGGRTVLFVSHNMASITALCDRGVLLNNGQISKVGTAKDIVNIYQTISLENAKNGVQNRIDRIGNGLARIIKINMIADEKDSNIINPKSHVSFEFIIQAKEQLKNVMIVFSIFNEKGALIANTTTKNTKNTLFELKKGKNKIVWYFKTLPLQLGRYYINVNIRSDNKMCDWVEQAFYFNVVDGGFYQTGMQIEKSNAIVILEENWKLIQ